MVGDRRTAEVVLDVDDVDIDVDGEGERERDGDGDSRIGKSLRGPKEYE